VKRTCYAQASQIRQVNLVLFSHLCVSLFDNYGAAYLLISLYLVDPPQDG
jgi:hypothetical protein